MKGARPSGPSAEPDMGLYLYGVGSRRGIASALEAERPEPIEPGADLDLVPSGDLAALFSPVSLEDYGESALEGHLQDANWTAVRAMKHEGVLERVAESTTIAPFRLGTVFLTRARVETMIEERRDELTEVLRRLKGRDEWSVLVYCDRSSLSEKIVEISPRLREMREAAQRAPKGQAYLMGKKIDALRLEEMRSAIQRRVAELERALSEVTEDRRRLRAQPDATEAAREAAGRMAFLVDRGSFPRFRAVAEGFADRHAGEGFRLELVGPLPAYNFVGGDGGEAS